MLYLLKVEIAILNFHIHERYMCTYVIFAILFKEETCIHIIMCISKSFIKYTAFHLAFQLFHQFDPWEWRVASSRSYKR